MGKMAKKSSSSGEQPKRRAKSSSTEEQPKKLTDSELIQLADEVKEQPAIWDLSDKNHKLSDVADSSWTTVASMTGLTVDECKRNWKSLKDKQRYRLSGKKKGLGPSGESGGEESQSDVTWSAEDNEKVLQSWKFGPSMNFLVQKPYSRRTLTMGTLSVDIPNDPMTPESNQENSMSANETTPTPSPAPKVEARSNYEYANKKRKTDDVGERLVQTVSELVNIRKEQKIIPNQTLNQLKHHSMLSNLDRMLSKLPDDIVEDLNMEFVTLTHEKIKEYRTTQVYLLETTE